MKPRYRRRKIRRLAAEGKLREAIAWAGYGAEWSVDDISPDCRRWIRQGAALGGQWDLFVQAGGPWPGDGGCIDFGVRGGDIGFCRKVLASGVDHWARLACDAICAWKQEEMLRDLMPYLETNLARLLYCAAFHNWPEGVRIILRRRIERPGLVSVFLQLIRGAAAGGHVGFVTFLRDEMAYTDLRELLVVALHSRHWRLAKLARRFCHEPASDLSVPCTLAVVRGLLARDVISPKCALELARLEVWTGMPWCPLVIFLLDENEGAKNRAAMACAVVIQFCEGFLAAKKYLSRPNACMDKRPANRWLRFVILAARLPLELQMSLCLRMFGLGGDVLIWDILRAAMRHIDMMILRRSDSVSFFRNDKKV